MPSNLAKAAVGALAFSGNGENPNSGKAPPLNGNNDDAIVDGKGQKEPFAMCPSAKLPKYHEEEVCITRPARPEKGHVERPEIYKRLKESGTGATLVPNQQTIVCPMEVANLENPSAIKGFDTTWIVENTASTSVVVSWVVDGVDWSPFHPDVKPMDDPNAILKPGEFLSVPTFESFVYHVREIDPETGDAGNVLLQHRAGLVSLGNPRQYPCDASLPDVEPVEPATAERKQEFKRTPTHNHRRCNTIDIGFRNQVGCPLHVYWANQLADVPKEGFNCGEKFKLHLGTKPATQDFMHDWESSTKFEGTFIGHTFVARLASNPDVVIDSYTLEPTRITDCPNKKQQILISSSEEIAEAVVGAEGTIQPLVEQEGEAAAVAGATIMADAAVGGMGSN